MKAAILAPTALLERYAVTDYHLALAHLASSENQYVHFYRGRANKGDWIMMDNGVIELGEPLSMEDTLRASQRIGVNEVIVPDFPGNRHKTVESAMKESAWVKNRTDLRVMVVPQGSDLEDWMNCFVDVASLNDVDVIGVPKSLGSKRIKALRYISDFMQMYPTVRRFDFHLLGTWGNPTEIQVAAQYPWIRGVDSKIPVRAGLAGVQFHPEFGLMTGRYQLPPLDFEATTDAFPIVTQYNVNKFIGWAKGEGLAEVRIIV